MKIIPKLHFITHPHPKYSLENMVILACEAGVPCIQLRMKGRPFDEVLTMAKKAREITHKFHTLLIINDHAEIAKIVHADGVHLGNADMPHPEARNILGDDILIGATANDGLQLATHLHGSCDYIGYGPYTYTGTKENAASPLGLNAYKALMPDEKNAKPILAIGGIMPKDIPDILRTGIYGIALSSGILEGDIKENSTVILDLLNIK